MKILLVSEDLPAFKLGGLSKHVVTLGNALIAAGHEVALMGKDAPSYAECADEIGFNGRYIAGFGSPFKGWKEHQLGFYNPWKRPYFARQLAKAIQVHAGDFDVVHYHGHLPMIGRYFPAGINFVQTRHDQGSDCIENTRFRNGDVCRERSAAACARCMHPNPGVLRTAISAMAVRRYRKETEEAYARHPAVFVSEFLRKNYQTTMPMAKLEQSTVIHNFVDEKILAQRRDQAKSPDAIGSVRVHIAGRIDEAKGISSLLDLLGPRLKTGWTVNIFGDGPLRSQVEAKHAGDGIRFHGHRLYREIVGATLNATVVVVPSVWEEPCGTVILEALRLGKVCYALRRGGTSELARYGESGQLRLFDDLPALVNSLLTSQDFSNRTGGESADVEKHMQKLLHVYTRRIQGS